MGSASAVNGSLTLGADLFSPLRKGLCMSRRYTTIDISCSHVRTFGFQGQNVGRDEEGEKVAGAVGEQEASWLSLPSLSLCINTTHLKALM